MSGYPLPTTKIEISGQTFTVPDLRGRGDGSVNMPAMGGPDDTTDNERPPALEETINERAS